MKFACVAVLAVVAVSCSPKNSSSKVQDYVANSAPAKTLFDQSFNRLGNLVFNKDMPGEIEHPKDVDLRAGILKNFDNEFVLSGDQKLQLVISGFLANRNPKVLDRKMDTYIAFTLDKPELNVAIEKTPWGETGCSGVFKVGLWHNNVRVGELVDSSLFFRLPAELACASDLLLVKEDQTLAFKEGAVSVSFPKPILCEGEYATVCDFKVEKTVDLLGNIALSSMKLEMK